MISSKDISSIIEKGEGISVEFKTASNKLPQSLFETVSAFLNRDGGIFLLGVDDTKNITGINENVIDDLCKEISNLSNNPTKISPCFLLHPTVIKYEGKFLIHIFVPISSQVHRCNGKIYDRSSDGDFELKTDEQIKNCYLRKSSFYTENTIYTHLYEIDFKPGIVEKARTIIRAYRPLHPWNDLTLDEFYKASGLYRKDIATGLEGFTLAALLLFGKEEIIQSALPHYKIDALLRRTDINRYDDRLNIRCNLIDAYQLLMEFTAKHLPDKFYMQGDQRISLREKIFREVIANFIIHREYANAYPSTFVIYTDRVEIANANKPHYYGQLLPEKFEPFPKNPTIAKFFVQLGRAEELGTGIRRVFQFINAYAGRSDVIFKEEDIFTVEVPLMKEKKTNGELTDELNGELTSELNEGQRKVFILIKENGGIQAGKISQILNIPFSTIDKHIRVLLKKKLIERRGSKKTGGYWQIF